MTTIDCTHAVWSRIRDAARQRFQMYPDLTNSAEAETERMIERILAVAAETLTEVDAHEVDTVDVDAENMQFTAHSRTDGSWFLSPPTR